MTELSTPTAEIPRDRYGRPLVVPADGGKPIAYTRCTTFVDCVEDKFNLQKWQQRMVARGLASRPDYLLRIQSLGDDADPGVKKQLNQVCEQAIEAAKGSAAATTGTALHALTELIDRGQKLPPLPAEVVADLEAYREATAPLKAVLIEQFCVLDQLHIGGTPDRVVTIDGKRYVADIKTGSIEFGTLKIASQIAVYARSATYDIATGERGVHGADTTRGLIIHLPAGQARCDLYWIDLEAGWEAVKVAKQVREARTIKFRDLTTPFTVDAAGSGRVFPTPGEKRAEVEATPAPLREPVDEVVTVENLATWIGQISDPDGIRGLYTTHAAIWTDELSDLARARIASLQEQRAS